MPFFTVIIPTYNRACMVANAVKSVLSQSIADWELIVVDDGSVDNTREVVTSFNDSRIRYYYQENRERSAARNAGIKLATGGYICFLDSDDYYKPNHLEVFYSEILRQNKPHKFFYCDLQIKNRDGSVISNNVEITDHSKPDFVFHRIIHSQQVCIHSEILKRHNFDTRFYIGEDMELWIRIADKYPVEYIAEQTVVVVNHDNRTVGGYKLETYLEMFPLLELIFSKGHPGHKISRGTKRKVLSGLYYSISRCHINGRQRGKAIIYLLKSVLKKPFDKSTKHRMFLLWKLTTTRKGKLLKIKKYIG